MDKRFIESMTSLQRLWLAHAIIGVTTADHVVEDGEFEFLQQLGELAPSLMEGKEESPLYQLVANKRKPNLDSIEVQDPKVARKMAITLLKVAAADGDIASLEVDYLIETILKLGVDEQFIEKAMAWALVYAQLNKQAQDLIESGE